MGADGGGREAGAVNAADPGGRTAAAAAADGVDGQEWDGDEDEDDA